VEVIEVDHMIVYVLDAVDDVPDDPGIVRDDSADCIFHSSHGALGVNGRSNPAET
jgi:hypothetical protein